MKRDMLWGEFRYFSISSLQVSGIRVYNDLWNREFQTPGSRKAERSRVVGSWRISAIDHIGGEVSGIRRSEFQEVRNLSTMDLASCEILKSERKKFPKH
jgi:hypothetical protein